MTLEKVNLPCLNRDIGLDPDAEIFYDHVEQRFVFRQEDGTIPDMRHTLALPAAAIIAMAQWVIPNDMQMDQARGMVRRDGHRIQKKKLGRFRDTWETV